MMDHQIELEKIKVTIAEKVSNELLDVVVDLSDEGNDFIRNMTTLRIQGYLWGENGETKFIIHPSTWWDAFKERWFPRWLLKHYRASHEIHEITLRTLYPNFRISMPSETHVLKYEIRSHSNDLIAS